MNRADLSNLAVWKEVGKVTVESVTVPEPAPHEVVVKVRTSGLCGTDLHIAAGEFPAARPGIILGHEYAGEVAALGSKVTNFKLGDRVTVDPNIPCHQCELCRAGLPHLCETPGAIGSRNHGGLAQYAVCPAAQVYRLPDTLEFGAAMLAEPLACTVHAIDRAQIRCGDKVLVIGAGP